MTVYTVSSILSISSGKIVEKMGWGLSPPCPYDKVDHEWYRNSPSKNLVVI